MDVGVPQVLVNGQSCLPHVSSPHLPGISDLDNVIPYPQVDGMFGSTLNYQLIVSGELEFGAEEAAGVGVAQNARVGRHGSDVEACAPGEQSTHQRPNAKDEDILGRKPIGVRRQFVPQPLDVEPPPAQEPTGQMLLSGMGLTRSLCEVDPQNSAAVAIHRRAPDLHTISPWWHSASRRRGCRHTGHR